MKSQRNRIELVIKPGKGQATHVTEVRSQLLVEGVYVRVQVAFGQKGWDSMGRPVFVICDTQVTLELPQLFVDGFDVDLDLGHVLLCGREVWSLTQLYSVDFSQSRIGTLKKCVYNKRTIKVDMSYF